MLPARAKISLLAFFFAVCLTAAVITAWLQARADANVKPADLYAVIDRQLGNLRNGDFPHAYEYASRAIQQQYTLQQFADMIQADYSDMTSATRAEYGPVQTRGPHATIQTYLIGPHGQVVPCIFILVHEADAWRIDGARISPPLPPDLRSTETLL
jgi:hypothetical protein